MRKFLFVFCLAVLMGCGSTSHFRFTARAYRIDPETQKLTAREVFGSGFFVNSTGLALTAAHIFRGQVPGTARAHVWWSGRGPGLMAGPGVVDWSMDLALVQTEVKRSIPAPILCTELTRGGKIIAIGAPDHRAIRSRGVMRKVSVEEPPCEAREETGGVGVRCASEKPYIYTPGARMNRSSPDTLAAIIEATAMVRSGYSGGSFQLKSKKARVCTAGVIIQEYEDNHQSRAIHPLSSPPISRYLFQYAPEFMQNFTN